MGVAVCMCVCVCGCGCVYVYVCVCVECTILLGSLTWDLIKYMCVYNIHCIFVEGYVYSFHIKRYLKNIEKYDNAYLIN